MNCDRIARWYRWLEYLAFGKSLERCRNYYLDRIADAGRVLMIGEGDGRFLKSFTQCNHQAEIDYVDASPVMLELARRRVAELGSSSEERVRFFRLDARRDPMPNPPYDVIVTHFFLDCITEEYLAEMVPLIRASAASGSRWIISEFRAPAQGIIKYVASCLLRTLYIFFRVTTGLEATALPSYRPILQTNGFAMKDEHISMMGLLVSELWIREDEVRTESVTGG